jgi:hypothetical protein
MNKWLKMVMPENEIEQVLKKLNIPKMDLWIKALIGMGVVVVLTVAIISSQPDEFSVSREITITAPVSKIFTQVNDFHNWAAWSPWEKMDPKMKKTFEGPTMGVGAVCNWAGNDNVGEGKMILTESEPNVHLSFEINLYKPFRAKNQMKFVFSTKGQDVEVNCFMTCRNSFGSKFAHLFVNPDKTVGSDLKNGLEQLKVLTQPGYKIISKSDELTSVGVKTPNLSTGMVTPHS